jgi:hypothetical protein
VYVAEAVAQRRAEHAVPSGRADKGEGLNREVHAARLESFVDDPGHEVVLHSRVQNFFYDAAESVDFVDKKDIALLHLRECSYHVSGTLDGGPRGGLDVDTHLECHDVGESRLTESGGAVQQYVVERFTALLRCLDADGEQVLDCGLSDVVDDAARAQASVQRVVKFVGRAGDNTLGHYSSQLSVVGLPEVVE